MILQIFFFKFYKVDISFTTNKDLLTTKLILIVNLKKYVIVILNINNKIFMIYIAIQNQKNTSTFEKTSSNQTFII